MIWRNNEALEILIALIRVLRIKVCKSYLEQLLDTPMGNSMRGMSDALDKLCIKNNVYKLPKESLNSAPTPIIAVLKNANHPFCVVVSISENNIAIINRKKVINIPHETFMKFWDGEIMTVEKTKDTYSDNFYMIKNLLYFIVSYKWILPFFIVFIFSFVQITYRHIFVYLHLIILWICTIISAIIIYGDNISTKYCKIGNHIDCNKVITFGRRFTYNGINIEKISLSFFSSLILYTIFNCYYSISLNIYLLYICIFIVVVSIILQALVLKKWCLSCITLDFFIICDFILLKYSLSSVATADLSFCSILCFTFIMFFVLSITKNIDKSLENYDEKVDFQHRYSYLLSSDISEIILKYGQRMAIPDEQTAFIYKGHSDIVITLITSLQCKNCFECYKLCNDLIGYATLKIVFIADNNIDNKELTMKILSIMIKDGFPTGLNYIKVWYKRHKYSDFNGVTITAEGRKIFNLQQEYCKRQQIRYTPMIIYNDKIIPPIYRTEDIKYLI